MGILTPAVTIVRTAVQNAVGVKPTVVSQAEALWATARLRPGYGKWVDFILDKLVPGIDQYQRVAKAMGNGIPFWFILGCHAMEAGAYQRPFSFHLHCGDPLTARTFHVPKGRPKANPGGGTQPPSAANPYSWEESAIDALRLMGYGNVKDWSIGNCLWLWEKFNGLGYRGKGVNTPYVWSYTTHYGDGKNVGKYIADGPKGWDPKAISKQPGTAAFLLRMIERGIISKQTTS